MELGDTWVSLAYNDANRAGVWGVEFGVIPRMWSRSCM